MQIETLDHFGTLYFQNFPSEC